MYRPHLPYHSWISYLSEGISLKIVFQETFKAFEIFVYMFGKFSEVKCMFHISSSSSSSLFPSTYPGPLHLFTLGYFGKAENSGCLEPLFLTFIEV